MDKKTRDVVRQLEQYFGVEVIGSQILVDQELLDESLTKDIDVMCTSTEDVKNRIHKFLLDAGFKHYPPQEGSNPREFFASPHYDKKIDLHTFPIIQKVYTLPELIKAKFERGYVEDLRHIKYVVETLSIKKQTT